MQIYMFDTLQRLHFDDSLRLFIMEAGFFVPSDRTNRIIININYICSKLKLFRQYIVAESMLYTSPNTTCKIISKRQNRTIQELYDLNLDSLYFSGNYYGNSRNLFNANPVMELKYTLAINGIVIVFKYDHRVIDGGTLLYLLKMILSTTQPNIKDIEYDTRKPQIKLDLSNVAPKYYHLPRMLLQAFEKGSSKTIYLSVNSQALTRFKNSLKVKVKVKTDADASLSLSVFDIMIALLVKFYGQLYEKQEYMISFFHDVRRSEALGNHFLMVDTIITRSEIQNLSIHELASNLKTKKLQMKDLKYKSHGESDVIFNPLSLPTGVKIKWPTEYKYYVNHTFPKQVYVCDNNQEIQAEFSEEFYSKFSSNKWERFKTAYITGDNISENLTSPIPISNPISNQLPKSSLEMEIFIKNYLIELVGGDKDDYESDQALSLFGVDSVSMMQLIERLHLEALTDSIGEDTTINDLIEMLLEKK